MLSLGQILGHPGALDLLRRMVVGDRLPHALIFRGPEGVGKATVARAFAAMLLCETDPAAGCGTCRGCVQVGQGSHPDLMWVRRVTKPSAGAAAAALPPGEAKEADLRSEIIVAQIRELTRVAGMAPRQGRHRVFVIDPADRMNRSAQNALLKTLEEPPSRTVLILVASRPHLLLPTVRSRSFDVGFSALRADVLAQLLEKRGMPRDEALRRASLAGGRVGLALDLDLESLEGRREELLEILEALTRTPAAIDQLPAMAASLSGKEEATLLQSLEILQGLLRDTARSAVDADPARLVHADLSERLTALSRHIDASRSTALTAACQRLRGYLRFNTNRALIAESLLAAVAGGPMPD